MAGTLTLEQGVDGTLSQGQEDARNARTSTLRAGSGRPHSARRTSPGLLPGAQLSDLSYGLPRQRNRIAFAADSHENVREGHARAAHPDVARLVSRVDLLSAYTASSCCYVAFMPWCLHNRLTDGAFVVLSAHLDIETLRRVCQLVSNSGDFTNP